MTKPSARLPRPSVFAWVVAGMIGGVSPVAAQEWPTRPPETILPRDLDWRSGPATTAANRPQRLHLFNTPGGMTSDIVRHFDAENETANREPGTRVPTADDDGPLDIAIAADNPFFDFREPGDLGGVGYQRYYTEIPLFDLLGGGLTLNCHAATPAGLASDGVENGPTRFNPALTWNQQLGGGAALQGFVGKTMRANVRGLDGSSRNLKYGMVLQQPLPGLDDDVLNGHKVFVFVETLGRSRLDDSSNSGAPPTRVDVLPGIHWQTGDNWWLSTGVKVPVGPARTDNGQFQMTCSWRY